MPSMPCCCPWLSRQPAAAAEPAGAALWGCLAPPGLLAEQDLAFVVVYPRVQFVGSASACNLRPLRCDLPTCCVRSAPIPAGLEVA